MLIVSLFYVTAFDSSRLENKLSEENDSNLVPINYLASIREINIGFCSGCVISQLFVLTAAECVVKIAKKKFFRLFEVIISKTGYSIKRVNYHRNFNSRCALTCKHFNAGLIMVNLLISFY